MKNNINTCFIVFFQTLISFSLKIFLLFFVAGLAFTSCNNATKKTDNKTETELTEIEILNNKINSNPDNAQFYNDRALYFINHNNDNEALGDIKKAIELDESNSDYYITLSNIYLYQGKVSNSLDAINKALELDTDKARIYLKLAEVHLILKEYQTTHENIEKALELDPINPVAYFINGYSFLEEGDTNLAIRNFQEAISQDQGYLDAFYYLGMIFSDKNDKLAVEYLNNALEIEPDNVEVLYLLGLFFQENEETEKAIEIYDRILKIDENNKYANYNKAYIKLVYLEEFENAIDDFSKAIETDPAYSDAYYNRGYCYELLNDFENSVKDYQKTLSLRPNHEKAINGLNRIDKEIK
ncbi:MAG: tetratricopeptide repeat protein [Bacteroidales bacterium]|nr:tetratricopeptide repeat protein [Bacteroidales bacterium]